MKAITVVPRASDPYRGFDATNGSWPNIEEWNQSQSSPGIELHDNIYEFEYLNPDQLNRIINYFLNLKEKHSELNPTLIYFNADLDESLQNAPAGFHFMGYDAGFIKEEWFYVLFSAIANEIGNNPQVFGDFEKKLNAYLLFDDLQVAREFAALRESLKGKNNYALESAYDNVPVEIAKVYNWVP